MRVLFVGSEKKKQTKLRGMPVVLDALPSYKKRQSLPLISTKEKRDPKTFQIAFAEFR